VKKNASAKSKKRLSKEEESEEDLAAQDIDEDVGEGTEMSYQLCLVQELHIFLTENLYAA